MKILFFVDTHGSENHMRKIIEKSKDAELIVCAGDFTVFENDIRRILEKFNSIGKPFMVIHGNHEDASSIQAALKGLDNIHLIHKTYHIHKDLVFFGYGGGGFLHNDHKFDIVADVFIKEFKDLEKKQGRSLKLVLVTHQPPYATRLDFIGEYTGLENFSKFIVKHQPIVAVSGHIHETAGEDDRINHTILINPGPQGKILDI